jgi:hypothetical protein
MISSGNSRFRDTSTDRPLFLPRQAPGRGERPTTDESEGRINWFETSQAEINGLQKELNTLRNTLRKASR